MRPPDLSVLPVEAEPLSPVCRRRVGVALLAVAALALGATAAPRLGGLAAVVAATLGAVLARRRLPSFLAPRGPGCGPFQDLADAAPVMLWVADARGRVTYLNRAWLDFTGSDLAASLGDGWRAAVHPADAPYLVSVIAAAVAAGDGFRTSVRLRRRDGYYRNVILSGRPLAVGGAVRGYVGSAADETESRQTGEFLAVSERRLGRFLADAPALLFSFGPDGVITLSEGRGLAALGRRGGEVVGRSVRDVYRDFPDVVRTAERALDGEEVAAELDLGPAVFDVWYSPRQDASGAVVEVTGVGVDVTARSRAERAARDRERLLTVLNRAHARFARGDDLHALFTELLGELLSLTGSEYGFIGEVCRDGGGPFLRTHAISDIAWDDATRELYRATAAAGMEFRNLGTLFGAVLRTGQRVIANDPAADPRRGGLPPGHPPLRAFLGLPFGPAGQATGMIGLANCPGGYTDELAEGLQPLLAACGAIIAARQAHRDREAAVAAVGVQKAVLESLTEAAPDGILVVDPAKRILTFNRRFAEMWGIPADLAAARDDARVLPLAVTRTADPAGFLARVEAIYADPAAAARDEIPLADGRTFERHTAPVRGADGIHYGRVWFFRDVTDRKRAADDLERLALIAQRTTNAVILTDPDARIEWVNEAFTRVTGYPATEAVGRKPSEFLQGPATDPATVRRMRDRLRAGEGFQAEVLNYRKDGSAYWVDIEAQPIRDDAGRVRRYMAVEQDVTARKLAEADLREQTERLAEQTRLAALRAEVGMALNRDAPLGEVLRGCCDAVLRHTGAAFVRAWTLNDADWVLELQASVGLYTHTDGPHGRVPVGALKIGRIAETREPVLTNQVLGNPRIPEQEWAAREGLVAFAGHPLVCEGRVVGVLALFARHELNPATLDALAVTADAVALGVVRLRAEAALRASEARQRAIVESSHDCIVTADEAGRIVEFNPAAEAAFRLPRAAALGRPIRNLLAPADPPRDGPGVTGLSHLAALPKPGGVGDLIGPRREGVAFRADGSSFPVELTVVRTDTAGPATTAFLRDITAEKEAEARRRVSEARQRAVVESAMDCVISIDRRGRVVEFNPAAERTFGFTKAEVLGRELGGLIIPAVHRDQHTAGVDRFVRTGVSHILGKRLVGLPAMRKDGSTFPAELTVVPMDLGGDMAFTAFLRDITDQREAEARRDRAEAEMKAAFAQAEAASQAKTQFLANMSHEFRTPMAAVVGYAEVLLDPRLEVDQRMSIVHAIMRNGAHLLSLINEVLDLAKIEAGKMEVERVGCRVWRVVAEALSAAGVKAQERNVSLEAQPDGRIPRVIHTDPTRLRQILDNLLSNAVKFTPDGRAVEVRVGLVAPPPPAPAVLRLAVTDQGIGIPADVVARLFQPFTQADPTTTRKFGGTGLGLSICKKLAEHLGGDIAVESAVGAGSTFTLTLPVAPADLDDLVDEDDLTRESQMIRPARTPTARTLAGRVLVAEDNPDNRNIVRYFLERAGLTVELAENGRVAVDRASAAEYDLILMDMQMPELDGYAATSTLRQKGYRRAIVALTAHAMAGDEERCLRAGCNAYLTKPVEADRLLNVVARYLPSKSWVVKAADIHRRPPPDPAPPPVPPADELTRLVGEFRRALPGKVAELAAARDAGDAARLAALAHKLKGSAGMYGLPALSETAGLLESACREGQDPGLIAELVDELAATAAAAAPG